MNEFELVIRAGLIFSEALCQAYNPTRAFLTEYSESVADHVARVKTDLIADKYFDKTWPERTQYYDLKVDEIVGNLTDEQLVSLKDAEPNTHAL